MNAESRTASGRWVFTLLAGLAACTTYCAPLFLAAANGEFQPAPAVGGNEPQNQQLSQSIQRQLKSALGPAADTLQVQAAQDTVILSGTVGDLLSRARALEIVRDTPGVQNLVSRLEVQPAQRPDSDLERDAQQALFQNAVTRDLQPQVAVQNGMVAVTGTVRSFPEKQLVSGVIEGIRGVRAVENNLSIQPMTRRTDQELQTEITHLLEADRALSPRNLQVQVVNGQATLTGTVPNLAEQARAVRKAFAAGAAEVEAGNLKVGSGDNAGLAQAREQSAAAQIPSSAATGLRRSDAEIQREILASLRNDPLLNAGSVSVKVRQGQVFVSGKVKTVDDRAALINKALVPGVQRVDLSQVRVEERPFLTPEDRALVAPRSVGAPTGRGAATSPPAGGGAVPGQTDRQIKENVQAALLYEPLLSTTSPLVEVENGTVTLIGTVQNLQEKQAAGQVAQQITGVNQVVDTLDVRPRAKVNDPMVAEQVKAALQRDALLGASPIAVNVQQGQVVLSGPVNSTFAKAHAESLVSGITGVTSIQNNLQPPAPPEP